jgi:hypothetical protein
MITFSETKDFNTTMTIKPISKFWLVREVQILVARIKNIVTNKTKYKMNKKLPFIILFLSIVLSSCKIQFGKSFNESQHDKYRTLWYRTGEHRYYDSSRKYGNLYHKEIGLDETDVMSVDTIPFSGTVKQDQDEVPIAVVSSKAIVSQTGLFGFVGKGSCVFDYSNAVDGYCIKVMKGDRILSTTFTDPQHLKLWVRRLKAELEKDSVLFTVHPSTIVTN